MYCVRFTVVFLLCLPAIGCQTIPEAIPQAEAIVMEHPDSAVRLLQGIPAPAKNLSRRNYARYALISTQARWLAGENLTGDTLSDVALAYYSTHTKDFVRVHKAYYYAAKIADRRHQPEIAMSLLLNSRQALPAAGEWQRHYVVETWLGVFCGKQRLYEEKVATPCGPMPTPTASTGTAGVAFRSATSHMRTWGSANTTAWNTMR